MINPSLALLSFAIYSFGVALSDHICVTFLLPIMLLAIFKFEIFLVAIKRLLFLNLFIIFVALSAIIAGNFHLAALIFIRSNLIMLFGVILFFGVDEYYVARGISGLKFGDKISSLFYLGIGFINALRGDFVRISSTLKARGFMPATSFFTYQTYANVVGLLILGAFKRSEAMRKTMLARGFSGKFILNERKLKVEIKDVLLLFCAFICVIFKIGVLL